MGNPSPPYFIGIALPPELSRHLLELKWKLHDEIAHTLKPLVPHITLLHPSSLRDNPADEILPKIRKVAEPYLPLALTLDAVEAFDRTVLFIRVHSTEIELLQAQLVGILPSAAQDSYRKRPYVPHITLAQIRAPHALDVKILRERVGQEIGLPCQVAVDSISYFMQTQPRVYGQQPI